MFHGTDAKKKFDEAAYGWLTNNCVCDITYFYERTDGVSLLREAKIKIFSLHCPSRSTFHIETTRFGGGRVCRSIATVDEVIALINAAASGELKLGSQVLSLRGEQRDYYSKLSPSDSAFEGMLLQVTGEKSPYADNIPYAEVDNELRCLKEPFDGVADLASSLSLRDPRSNYEAPRIEIVIEPPIDLILDQSQITDDMVSLAIECSENLMAERLTLGLRTFSQDAGYIRRQIVSAIKWSEPEVGIRVGRVSVPSYGCESALAMLSAGGWIARREWLNHPKKGNNFRRLVMTEFDPNLKRIRKVVQRPGDYSSEFENAIAAIFYLAGFNVVLPVETNAPDLILRTPKGRTVLVECTTRISDFASKLGKLVDRRGQLEAVSQANDQPFPVMATLICGLPGNQVAGADDARRHGIGLVCQEEILSLFDTVLHSPEPDALAISTLSAKSISVLNFGS